MGAVAAEMPPRFPDCTPHHFAQVLMAFASMGAQEPAFLTAVTSYVPARFAEFSNQHFCQVCRALVQLEFQAAEFDAAVTAEARSRRLSAIDFIQLLPLVPELRERALQARDDLQPGDSLREQLDQVLEASGPDREALEPAQLAGQLPPGWTEHSEGGRPYYYHAPTGVTQWARPGLLEGWVEYWDSATSLPYYHHGDSGVTQWERPGTG